MIETRDHPTNRSVQMVACPFCEEELSGRQRVAHLMDCEEVDR